MLEASQRVSSVKVMGPMGSVLQMAGGHTGRAPAADSPYTGSGTLPCSTLVEPQPFCARSWNGLFAFTWVTQ